MGTRERVTLTARRVLALAYFFIAFAACSGPTETPLASLPEGGVFVTVAIGRGNTPTLIVKIRPDKAGFHVYSTDLNPALTRGLGIPTRIRIVDGLGATGAQRARPQAETLRIETLGVSLPVYPDGTVTITTRVIATNSARATVAISYGACSKSVCLKPVIERRLTFTLPHWLIDSQRRV